MTLRITWARAAAAVVALILAGLLFAWSGLFNVAASSGHWKATEWFLHWVMRNSVRTHAAFATPDEVTTREGLVSAAGHFAGACASCHGAPGQRPLPVMQKAMPPAPDLSVNAREWTDRQTFWILKHGVKYSGMPAWAAKERPDEIRRMVAFVRRLPEMTPAEYRSLAGEAGQVGRLNACVACHGADGRGRGQPDIPVLGGQSPAYLARTLADYAAGRRDSAVMAQAAALLTPEERVALAKHFAAMPGLGRGTAVDDARAQDIAERGLPRVQLPACLSCHKPGGSAPVLTGQKPQYLAARLRHWKGDGKEIDARQPQDVMPVISRRIPDDMIDRLSRYLAGR
ncbi:cytochrome c553 [Sphingomonas jinjuensis]|uniref:Cytochrome c553 n=1 Tax=Sphingomonas jinjuensis TaxID=535907 RepID=A0A840FKM9_9SPHN|nr:c-type cytochrome [Sphingomonas jinjuensis]MBB4153875.1 cytochrome c553 [Sphingomonas jinjuensis]